MSNTVVVRAVVVLVGLTVLAIVALALFRVGDNTAVSLQIVGIVAPTTVALLAYLQSSKNNEVIAKVDQAVATNTKITESTLNVSNGHLTAALNEIRQLKEAVASLTQTAALKAVETSATQAMGAQILDAIAALPSTPPDGTLPAVEPHP